MLLDRRPSLRPKNEFIFGGRFTIGREIKMQKIMTHFVLCVGAQMILQLKRRNLDLRRLFNLRFLHTTHTKTLAFRSDLWPKKWISSFEVSLVCLKFI